MTSCYMSLPKAADNLTLVSASGKDRPMASPSAESKGSSGPKNVRGYQEECDLSDMPNCGAGRSQEPPQPKGGASAYMAAPK